jgi:hypothetical protein
MGGKLVGFRFVTVALGPLSIDTTQEGRRVIRLNRQLMSAGAALSVPTSTCNLRLRTAVMTVAGPSLPWRSARSAGGWRAWYRAI